MNSKLIVQAKCTFYGSYDASQGLLSLSLQMLYRQNPSRSLIRLD